jgi:hypothetical protein
MGWSPAIARGTQFRCLVGDGAPAWIDTLTELTADGGVGQCALVMLRSFRVRSPK